MKKLKDLFIEALEKDTRDNSDLFVYRLKSQLDYKDFQKVSKMLKNNKIYYSRFKNGFISKTKIDFDILDLEVKETSTKYLDFGIAERFGDYAIKDTYNKMVKEYNIENYKELTELVMVLNWKLWEHYENGNEKMARLYDELWRESCDYIIELLKDDSEKLSYYYRTTD